MLRDVTAGLVAAVAAALYAPCVALAEDVARDAPERLTYVEARGGTYLPGRGSAGVPRFRGRLDTEVVVGRVLRPFLAVELGVGHFAAERERNTTLYPFNEASPGRVAEDLSVVPITASFRVIAPLGFGVEPYLTAGAGVYLATLEKKRQDQSISLSDSDKAFGVHAGLGLSVSLGEGISASADARYVEAQANLFSTRRVPDVDPPFWTSEWVAESHRTPLGGVRATAGFSVRF